jgi:hypothetical protein
MAVTVQQAALPLLRYVGINQLTPEPTGSQLETCQPTDLDNAALAITQAIGEIHEVSPIENREVSTGAILYGPTAVTLNVTQGSTTISGLSSYAARMNGATIRIGGDDQDNELASQTQLARPYNGSTGSVSATIYGDSVTLPSTYSRAIGPLWLPNNYPMPIADSLEEFIRMSGYPMVVSPDGRGDLSPLFSFIRKSVGRPRVAMAVGAYDGTLEYVMRRLRVAPLPDQNYTLAFRAAVNPPKFTRNDIVSPLATLTVSGSGDSNANQSYTYLCDINGYRAFSGVTHTAYMIFYAPWSSAYVIASSATALLSAPASYHQSNAVTSPLGAYTNEGTATGTATVATSDTGGGAGDPGTLIPIVDAAVELILIPMALWRFTSTPSFRNESAKAGIEKQYRVAIDKLKNSRALTATRMVTYY